jgi:hypothetical protein
VRPPRSLTVVASLPSRCALCQGEERMRIHPPAEPHTAVDINCPHCHPAGIPILHLSAYPREASA